MRLPYRLLASILLLIAVKCDEIEKYSNFNENLREYSINNFSTSDNVRTLQSEKAVNALFTPSTNPVKFKDVSDNVLAGTSHVKGFAPHSKAGYAVHDYDDHEHEHNKDHGHYGLGYDYFVHEIGHHDGHGHGYGHEYGYHHPEYNHHHHHKHFDHALATKAILWPIAGIALLGAAAALVSNPILLQLGVVSGKRRRRDTEEITGPDFEKDFITTLQKADTGHINTDDLDKKTQTHVVENNKKKKQKKWPMSKAYSAQNGILQKEHRIRYFENFTPKSMQLVTEDYNDDGLVPIPLKTRQKMPS